MFKIGNGNPMAMLFHALGGKAAGPVDPSQPWNPAAGLSMGFPGGRVDIPANQGSGPQSTPEDPNKKRGLVGNIGMAIAPNTMNAFGKGKGGAKGQSVDTLPGSGGAF